MATDPNTSAPAAPPAPEAAPKAPRVKTAKQHLLDQLKNVTSVRLNLAREVIFTLRSSFIDNRSEILLHLDRLHPNATFGKGKTPKKEDLPDRCLAILVRALEMGSIVDVSDNPQIATAPYKPLPQVQLVEKGFDPVNASGQSIDVIRALLKGPDNPESVQDLEGEILDRIDKRFRVAKDIKALIAVQHEEASNKNRPRIISAIEDWILNLREQQANA